VFKKDNVNKGEDKMKWGGISTMPRKHDRIET